MTLLPPVIPIEELETRQVLKLLTKARAALAELKGVANTIPNEEILIDTLSLQEAKDSSAIENIITTHDELYVNDINSQKFASAPAKEVHNYAEALKFGYSQTRAKGFISTNDILRVQEIIEGNNAGIRRVPGTVLKNELTQKVVYTPPQEFDEIMSLMSNLEAFINNEIDYPVDPLIKMALIHHQFESIHPFFDGNGRTGRIVNILYLINENLLALPILYLSRFIIKNRSQYYALLQSTRENGNWEEWIIYMLQAVEETSKEAVVLVKSIKSLMIETKTNIRSELPKIYSQDLINNLFRHPYTKVASLQKDLQISRVTATKYLNLLSKLGVLDRVKHGRFNYYINRKLFALLLKSNNE